MFDYKSLSILDQRRKSSPELLSHKPKKSIFRHSIQPSVYNDDRSPSVIRLPAAPVFTTNSIKKKKRLSVIQMMDTGDIELATKIGKGLLSEIRRLKMLLCDKQNELNQVDQDSQLRYHELMKQLKCKSDLEEKLKKDVAALNRAMRNLTKEIEEIKKKPAIADEQACTIDQLQTELEKSQKTVASITKEHDLLKHVLTGESLLKFTRFGYVHSRFFWFNPFTKTLYWGAKKKSIVVDSYAIDIDTDHNPIIIIKSIKRQVKMKCTTRESHEKWIKSLHSFIQ